jgi:hypothetical protein
MRVSGSSEGQAAMGPPATAKQIKFLRRLALQTGESFAYPEFKGMASIEIKRLLELSKGDARDIRREERSVRDAVARGAYRTAGWD